MSDQFNVNGKFVFLSTDILPLPFSRPKKKTPTLQLRVDNGVQLLLLKLASSKKKKKLKMEIEITFLGSRTRGYLWISDSTFLPSGVNVYLG